MRAAIDPLEDLRNKLRTLAERRERLRSSLKQTEFEIEKTADALRAQGATDDDLRAALGLRPNRQRLVRMKPQTPDPPPPRQPPPPKANLDGWFKD